MMPYLFTSDALVSKPLNESPRRFNQNRSSSFFKVVGKSHHITEGHFVAHAPVEFCSARAASYSQRASAGFQRGDRHLFVIFFGEGCKRMTSLPIFLTLWILVVFAGSSDEDISMFKVRTKREKSPKT